MNDPENVMKVAEENQSAEDFIASIAPMTATSGQINILQELGNITGQDSILELWCGGGDLTAQLADITAQVIGTDYSLKLIDAAKNRFPNLEFIVSEADNIVFPDATFDVVVCNFIAHHFETPDKIFTEARRVLKPGGRLLVTIPIQSKRVGFNIVLKVARELVSLPEKVVKGGPLVDAESPEEIIKFMRIAGFKKFESFERTNYTVLASIDTLLKYAWQKIGLDDASIEIQKKIRSTSTKTALAFQHTDNSFRFPDQILAVRGNK